MAKMKSAILLCLLLTIACKKGMSQTDADAISGAKTYRDRMCACTDFDCGSKVNEDHSVLLRSWAANSKDEAAGKQVLAIDAELRACFAKLQTAGR